MNLENKYYGRECNNPGGCNRWVKKYVHSMYYRIMGILDTQKMNSRDTDGNIVLNADGSPMCFIKMEVIRFETELGKIGEELQKNLERQGYTVTYESNKRYRCYKEDDIRKSLNIPEIEKFTIVDCPWDIEEIVVNIIKENDNLNSKIDILYHYIDRENMRLLKITNDSVKNQRKNQEQKRTKEAIELMEKLFK